EEVARQAESAIHRKIQEEVKANRRLTIERMVELGQVSRSSFYRFGEDRPDGDMEPRFGTRCRVRACGTQEKRVRSVAVPRTTSVCCQAPDHLLDWRATEARLQNADLGRWNQGSVSSSPSSTFKRLSASSKSLLSRGLGHPQDHLLAGKLHGQ